MTVYKKGIGLGGDLPGDKAYAAGLRGWSDLFHPVVFVSGELGDLR